MDDARQHETGRHKVDYYRTSHTPWNMMNQHQPKEPNALVMNQKIMSIIAERDAAISVRNAALSEKNNAIAERDEALRQRDEAFSQRNTALMERDSALVALQIRKNSMNVQASNGVQRGVKRTHHPSNHLADTDEAIKLGQPKQTKENNASNGPKPRSKKGAEDLNETQWDSHDMGLNVVAFHESTVPVPVCSCTGIPRQCYKWGSGGWQSSCCTTNMSMFPLPQMSNTRRARMGGRKMSGGVFARLLSRVVAQGHELSIPLDLKQYWARHGTNRYVTIK